MKKTLFFLLVLAMISGSAEPPQSITLESGNVRIRLDAKKRWNINRIEWKNQLLGIDSPGAHYGIVYKPADGKYPIGTGHTESGIGEEVISLKIFADGKEVTPEEKKTISGKMIRIEKISRIADFSARSSTILENDILRETAEVSAVNVQIKSHRTQHQGQQIDNKQDLLDRIAVIAQAVNIFFGGDEIS